MSKDLIKKHSESITHNTIGGIISYYIIQGVPSMIGLIAALSSYFSGVPLWLVILIGSVIFFLLSLTWDRFRQKSHRRKPETQDESTAISESEVKKRLDALKESLKYEHDSDIAANKRHYESEVEALTRKHEAQIATLNIEHEREIINRRGAFDSLKDDKDKLAQRLADYEKYNWLIGMAAAQANDIDTYVVVEQVRFCYHDLTAPIPYLIFGVDILNKSVFYIAIEDTIGGHIELAGERLLGDKELIHNPKIPPSSKESLTIKQRLSPIEVNLVTKCDNNELGAFYYFEKLSIMIAARSEYPQFERTRLTLPKSIGSKDTPLSTEIASLRAQLEEEKAKRTKPNITGKIKGVYFEWWAKPLKNDTEGISFDYHFIINVYLANSGTVATIEQFKVVLKSGENSYDGERERDIHDVQEGEMNWREWGANELNDLEKSNDTPLEHTRNGALWFVVRGIPKTEDESKMELELYVIDKDGTSYKLDTFPKSKWEKNPFLHEAQVKEYRARMKQMF